MHVRTIILLAGAALAATGCGDAVGALAENAFEEAVGAEIDADSEGFSIETSEGTISAGAGAELPEQFPDDFPVPDGGTPVGSFATATDGVDEVSVSIAYETATLDDLAAALQTDLPAAGYEIVETTSTDMGGISGTVFSVEHPQWTGVATASQLDDGTETVTTLTIALSGTG